MMGGDIFTLQLVWKTISREKDSNFHRYWFGCEILSTKSEAGEIIIGLEERIAMLGRVSGKNWHPSDINDED